MKSQSSVVRLLLLFTAALFLVTNLSATPVPKNLGNGLDKLVESRVVTQNAKAMKAKVPLVRGFATAQAASYDALAIKDPKSADRYLVDIHPNSRVPFEQLKAELTTRFPSLKITAEDTKYRGVGVIEGYVSIDDVAALATVRGVTSVQLGLKPYLKKVKTNATVPKLLAPRSPDAPTAALTLIGTTFDQGVTQHRVDKINTVYDGTAPSTLDGSGMSVAALSDSFDTRAAAPHASTGVTNFDLPGAGGNPYNTTPVFVLQDDPGGTDEGRGMCEILYKMAPRAKIGFATANGGELSFANSIRALAGINTTEFPNASTQGFAAQVICDDVGYFDEPWFQDGIIGEGIDDVAAAGISYFSSASNNIGTNSYSSVLRWVANGTGNTAAAGNTALAGTNIDLTGVPSQLIAGGFHNFNPAAGQQDVAQTWAIPSGDQLFVMQWDDAFDQNSAPPLDGPPIYSNNGSIPVTTNTVTFNDLPALTAGELYELDTTATGGGLDIIVTVLDPSSNSVVFKQDHSIDELVHFFAPVSGSGYSIIIEACCGSTGTFHLDLYHAFPYTDPHITTRINLLAFRIDTGAFIAASSLTGDNFATNQPLQLGAVTRPTGQQGVQLVIARSNVPSGRGPGHIRMEDGGNGAGGIGPSEYFTYDSVATGGHDTARGCNGTAAYSVFRPSRPETFTSPGPVIYYFDKMSNRLTNPELRLQPRIAAADQGNTSFFNSDSANDGDGSRNFSGTSAASPHAAAIAALVLQAHGGPGMVTPAQMSDILQRSTFIHDLDPMFAGGSATAGNGGTVTISINSDSSNILPPTGTNPAITSGLGMQDTNSWKVSYSGPGFLTSLTFNPTGTAGTGGSPTSGNNGVDSTNTYFSNVYPGVAFATATKAFTLGTLTGLTGADVTSGFSNLAPLPSNGTSVFWTMALGFPNSNFTAGKAIRFTVGRGQQHTAAVGTFASPQGGAPFAGPNSGATTNPSDATADLLGGGVQIPEGTLTANGMTFSGTVSDGVNTFPFNGTINNSLGTGYSPLDGYGFINAQTAVTAPISGPSAVAISGAASRKNHPGAGNLDINLPLAGAPAIECRSGGANGDFTIVFKFANNITSLGRVSLTDGTASIASSSIQANEVVVNVTGVTNAQTISVALVDIADSLGGKSPSYTATMSVLLGDTTSDGSVNSADIAQTKSRVGQAVDGTTLRQDVNVDGAIDSADIALVKSRSGNALP